MSKKKFFIALIILAIFIVSILYFMQDLSFTEKVKWSGLLVVVLLPLCFFASRNSDVTSQDNLPVPLKKWKHNVIQSLSTINILFSIKYIFNLWLESLSPPKGNIYVPVELFLYITITFFSLVFIMSLYFVFKSDKISNSKQDFRLYTTILISMMFLILLLY